MKLVTLYESFGDHGDLDGDLKGRNQEYRQAGEPPAYPISERVDEALMTWDLVRGLFSDINLGLVEYYLDSVRDHRRPERLGEQLAILIHVINRRYNDAINVGAKFARGLGNKMPKASEIPSFERIKALLAKHLAESGPQGQIFQTAFLRMYAVFNPNHPEEN